MPKPDENLVSYLDRGLLRPGRALDLGCGPGRNAIFLASRGFEVDAVDRSAVDRSAVDRSAVAVAWARERAERVGGRIRFHCADIFSPGVPPGPFDFVYDSGCLHHVPPHRRVSYLASLERVLAPGGQFAVACFAVGQMGSELADGDFYRQGSLQGGVAYSADALRWIFSELTEIEVRPMAAQPPGVPVFSVAFLLTGLFRRPPG